MGGCGEVGVTTSCCRFSVCKRGNITTVYLGSNGRPPFRCPEKRPRDKETMREDRTVRNDRDGKSDGQNSGCVRELLDDSVIMSLIRWIQLLPLHL
jgi:hypothetical protein